MKLYSNCKSCKEPIPVKSLASTRSELEKDKGETFRLNCSNCGNQQSVHVNDIRAKENSLIVIIGVLLSLVLTVFLWVVIGFFGLFSTIVPMLIWRQQANAVHTFNSYLINR